MLRSCWTRLLSYHGTRSTLARCMSQSPQLQQIASPIKPIEIPENNIINPLEHEDFFNVKELFSLRDLFMARVHLGHTSGVRNPFMIPYLFGNRLGTDVIDLDQTVELLRDALNVMAHIAYRGGIILFINRSVQTIPIVEKTAEDVGEYAHCRRWKLGTFTNSATYYGSMVRLPDLCVFINSLDTVFEEHPAVIEAAKMNIPSVGIMDTNCDPRLISYPIPGNDDTPVAVQFYCNMFKAAIQKGKSKRLGTEQTEKTDADNSE